MKLILDTHTLIWYLEGADSLSRTCREEIENPDHENFVSVVSFWEMAIKLSIGGKLDLTIPFEDLNRLVWENGFTVLPVLFEHTVLVKSLPFHHKDPFDRLLIAQAGVEGMTILSRDQHFDAYGVVRIW